MKKQFFAVILSALALPGLSQDLWSLDKCINYAFEHNIQVQQSELQIENAKVSKEASWANVFPNLNLNTGYFWTFGKSIDPITNVRLDRDQQTSSLTLSSNWIVFDGLQNVNNIQRAKIDYLAAVYDLESMKNDIALQVTSQYLQVLLNKEVKEIATSQYDISVKLLNRTEQLYEAGSVAKSELLQVQARLASDDQSIVAAENNEMLGLLTLSQLLQLDSVSQFDIVIPELNLPDNYLMLMSANDIYNQSVERQPDYKSAQLNVESAQSSLAISKGAWYPTLSVQAQINTNYANSVMQAATDPITVYSPNLQYSDPTDPTSDPIVIPQQRQIATEFESKPFGTQYTDNVNQFVGLNLRIPIFNNFNVRSNVRNSKIQLANAELNLKSTQLDFKQTVERAHADAKASYKSYLASQKSVESNEESWNYAQKLKTEGAMNQYDYENARFQYLQSVSNMLQAKYDYIFKIKVLEFYLNSTITLD